MYLESNDRTECFGCEACVQICGKNALSMVEDEEGFRYPIVNESLCVDCGKCRKVCPHEHMPQKHEDNKYVFGGYYNNPDIRFDSTSGGVFSAIVDAYCCDENCVIVGAEAKGLLVFHSYITDKRKVGKFRKSKYLQSIIGSTYRHIREFLIEGKKVLFSGTPCQIAGLLAFLGDVNQSKLLTIEVVCEGVPSPLYIRKMDDYIEKKYGSRIETIDYRYTGRGVLSHGKWDFQQMRIELASKKKILIKDRWFNPFWSIWLQHLMSRPSCYKCAFAERGRVADITLGDLWGVHLYCPELYGSNGGSSLVVCNTQKGEEVFQKAREYMYGHELLFEDAIKYQGPLRKPIENNEKRNDFLSDLQSDLDIRTLNRKWAKPLTLKLFFQKYLWGNRQKIAVWNIKQKVKYIRRSFGGKMYYLDPKVESLYRIFDQNDRKDYLRLDLNENPGGLPEDFLKRVLDDVNPQFVAQYPETRHFTEVLAKYLGTDVSRLCLVNGSAEGIRYIIQAFTSPGGRIVGVVPSYFMFQVYSEMYGRDFIKIPYDDDLNMDVNNIIAEMTTDTQLLVLLNPNNPMGNVYSEEEFERILKVAQNNQITILIDEAYHYFYPKTFMKYALEEEHIFVTRTFSKLFSMAGCRLGYVAGWPDGVKMVQKMCTPHNTNVFAMKIAEAMLTTPGMVDELVHNFSEGRQYVINWLDEHGYSHKGEAGNFIFIKPNTDAKVIVYRMKNEKKILIKTYAGVGELGDCLRVSIGEKKYMEKFTAALAELDR